MKNIICFILFISSLSGYSQGNSILWEIKGKDLKKPSYLYGTYHSKDARAHEFGDSVSAKLSECDAVAVENIDLGESNGEAKNKKILEMVSMEDKTLANLMSADDYKLVKDSLAKTFGLAAVFFNSVKPIFTVTLLGLNRSREEMPYTVDDWIKLEAKKRGKGLYGLETSEEVEGALDAISLKEQAKMLVSYFKSYNKEILLQDSMVRLYQSQDLDKMYAMYKNEKDVPLSFEESLVDKRNKKFLKKITTMMEQQPVFFAVGALHLTGETGLINMLRKKGYEVTPVISRYSFRPSYIDDKREWYTYGNDSLYFRINLQNDPWSMSNKFPVLETDSLNGLVYGLEDSINGLSYRFTAIKLPATFAHYSDASIYKMITDQLDKRTGVKKIKEANVEFKNHLVKEVEYNLSAGVNGRYRIIENDGYLYLIAISGAKYKLYSNIAEKYLNSISWTTSLDVELNVVDNESNEPLEEFSVSILGKSVDTVLSQDGAGKIGFILTSSEEDEYTITIQSDNYVSKKLMINTTGINKTGEKSITLPDDVLMIRSTKGRKYSFADKIVQKAYLMNDTTFDWDKEYTLKMQNEIEDELSHAAKIKK